MREIVICSGKGGAGKTTIAAILFSISKTRIVCDCDVEGANLHLLLEAEKEHSTSLNLSQAAYIDQQKCISCGKCIEYCRFQAIKKNKNKVEIITEKCEGCRVCQLVCPTSAIEMIPQKTGDLITYKSPYGMLISAELSPGAGNSGRLTTQLKQLARQKSKQLKEEILIIDGPPGIGCPTIAAINGATEVLVIVEASPSGIEDAKRLIHLAKQLKIPCYAVINKTNINSEIDNLAFNMLKENNCQLITTIPYNLTIPEQTRNNKIPTLPKIKKAAYKIAQQLAIPVIY